MTDKPKLPLELEREIFKLAALAHPVSIPSMLRVAWRIKEWVEPLLYHTLVIAASAPLSTRITDDALPHCTVKTFMEIRRTKPASFLRNAMRNVMFAVESSGNTDNILSVCPALENLYMMPGESNHLLATREIVPLKRLTCGPKTFQYFSQSSSSHITHLKLFYSLGVELAHWDRVVALPHLTHLSIGLNSSYPISTSIYLHLLAACKSLSALIIDLRSPIILGSPSDDTRFVVMKVTGYVDWQRGILTGNDYWTRADAFIAKRRSGEIERSTFFLDDDSSE